MGILRTSVQDISTTPGQNLAGGVRVEGGGRRWRRSGEGSEEAEEAEEEKGEGGGTPRSCRGGLRLGSVVGLFASHTYCNDLFERSRTRMKLWFLHEVHYAVDRIPDVHLPRAE